MCSACRSDVTWQLMPVEPQLVVTSLTTGADVPCSACDAPITPVAWQFEQRGLISVLLRGSDPDEVTLAAIDAGAADVGSPDGGALLVVTGPADLEQVRTGLAAAGYDAESAELSMEPTTRVEIADEKAARQVLGFVEKLEDLDDVQNVYANFDIPAELMEQLEAQVA